MGKGMCGVIVLRWVGLDERHSLPLGLLRSGIPNRNQDDERSLWSCPMHDSNAGHEALQTNRSAASFDQLLLYPRLATISAPI